MGQKRRGPPDGHDYYDLSSKHVSACKRIRVGPRVTLCDFSDEILLKILAFLHPRQLLCIERVSQRLRRLAADTEIWRLKYFDQWIFARLPGLRARPRRSQDASVRPHIGIRLPGQAAVMTSSLIDWKRMYQVRRNWDQGLARLQEIKVAPPASPPVLAAVCRGLIFTADGRHGLRVWSKQDGRKQLLDQTALDEKVTPLSLAADASKGKYTVAVGYADRRIDLYWFRGLTGFLKLAEFTTPTGSGVVAVEIMWPYVLDITREAHVHLHRVRPTPREDPGKPSVMSTTLQPIAPVNIAAISLRRTAATVIASITYAFQHFNGGLCIGLHEMRVSRVVNEASGHPSSTPSHPSSTPSGHPSSTPSHPSSTPSGHPSSTPSDHPSSTLDTSPDVQTAEWNDRRDWRVTSRETSSSPLLSPFAPSPLITSLPSSLSYSHPYLLACLPDNTMMAYLVTSNDDKLEMSAGRRLWGHTSAISRAAVTHKGRAVSVSARGNDVRVWELEDELLLPNRAKTSTAVTPINTTATMSTRAKGQGLGLTLQELRHTLALTQHWVGFDDEQIVVMCERDQSQFMACYDFM
ncbi:hypothetical protein DV735_g1949, partial [Chaetothyriales sp. CBS 134920]